MAAQKKKGKAKSGYFYENVGEDAGSISATVPSGEHIEPLHTKAQLTDIWNKAHKPVPQQKGGVGIKHEVVAGEREARGEQDIGVPAFARSKGWQKEVEAKVDSGEIDPKSIVDKIINLVDIGEKPPVLSDESLHALLYDKTRIKNELKSIEKEESLSEELINRRNELEDAYNANEHATEINKTGWGRAGLTMQEIMREDYSLVAMLKRAKEDGVEITPEVRKKYEKLSKKIENAQINVNNRQTKETSALLEKTIEQVKNEEALSKRKQKRESKAGDLDVEFETLINEFAKNSGTQFGSLLGGVDIANTKLLVDMTRNRIRKGIVKAEDIVDSIHTALKNAGIELSKLQIRDAISKYGQTKEMSKEEISVALREAKRQMQLISALEDAKKALVPLSTGLKRDKASDRVRELQKEVTIAMRESGIGRFSDEAHLEAFRNRVTKQIAEYKRRLKEGDFAKKAKKVRPELREQELKLEYELDAIKREYARARINDQLAQRGMGTIAKDSVVEAMNLIRAIKSSFDVSAAGRQGFFAVISHPIKGFKNIPEMFRALKGEEAAFRIETEIRTRKNYKLYKEADLSLTETKGSGSKVEELYRSRWAQNIPGIPASERAFVSFLNLMRADLFDTMYKNNFSKRPATLAEKKALGDYVNQATGRGTIKGYENAMVGLGTFLWAPKLVLSRFQIALGKGLMPGGGRTAATRIAVAKEYARILASLSLVYAINDFLGIGEVEWDPRSSDFGKIRIGNTRIDLLAGVSQVTVFMSRIISGETKSIRTGEIRPIRGDYVPYGGTTTWGVISNFLRTKLTPALGVGINLVEGKDLVGNKVTLYDVPEETLVPLAILDVYEAMAEEGIPTGMALGTLGLFGVGIQTHEQRGARR